MAAIRFERAGIADVADFAKTHRTRLSAARIAAE